MGYPEKRREDAPKAPVALFDAHMVNSGASVMFEHDVTADSKRFLVNTTGGSRPSLRLINGKPATDGARRSKIRKGGADSAEDRRPVTRPALPLLLARVLIISRHMDLDNIGRDAMLVGEEAVG